MSQLIQNIATCLNSGLHVIVITFLPIALIMTQQKEETPQ